MRAGRQRLGLAIPAASGWPVTLATLALSLWLGLFPGPATAGTGPPAPRVITPAELPARLVMPAIQLDSAIEPMALVESGGVYEWLAPEDTVGWHDTSAVPGQAGNLVLSGHNASLGGKVFRNLYRAQIGDRFTIRTGQRAFIYEIAERHVLRELFTSRATRQANAAWIREFPDERVTLVTCHPTWTNTHRLVLVARRIPLFEQTLAVAHATAELRRMTGLAHLQVSVPPYEIAAQARPGDPMTFDAALRLAVRSFMVEGEAQLRQPGASVVLLKQGEAAPRGETVTDNWIFRLATPDPHGGHRWAVVSRNATGSVQTYRAR
jgi:LPXTG-site transpeptidase (sortase) family protein